MTDRAEEIARKIVRETTDDVEEYALLEHGIVDALRAYGEEAKKEEREAWLNRAAEIEGEIAGDPRHTAQEILGAHLLGAALRAAEIRA